MGSGVQKHRREPTGKHRTLDSKPINDLPTIQGQLFWLDQCGQWIGVWAVLKGHELTRSPVDTPLTSAATTDDLGDLLCPPETIDLRTWSLSYNEQAYGRKHCFELMRSDRRFGRRRCEMFSTKSEGEIRIWLHRLKFVVSTSTNMFESRIMARSMKDNRTRFEDEESEIDNDLMKKILEDRTRLRERAKTMDMQIRKHSAKENASNDISYNPVGSYKIERARKQVIEEKLNEISKCIDGDPNHELKDKVEDLRFELDELDIKLSQAPYRKRGSVERRTDSNCNLSFKNDANMTENKRRSLLKSHALAFNSQNNNTVAKNLKRTISLGGAHDTRSQYTARKVDNAQKQSEIHVEGDDQENLKYLENINNFEKLLFKMQSAEFTKC